MKKFIFLFGLIALMSSVNAQNIVLSSITHDGLQRDYRLYIPSSYDGSEAVPIIFNFHGLGSNAAEQEFYSNFMPIADTANFLVVHPQGTLLLGEKTHWNVGGPITGSTVDDVGFTSALLDTLIAAYNIDESRVYSTGMSNGGFMSHLLACRLSDRFAAIAAVTGTMSAFILSDCTLDRPVPVLQMHGTADSTVFYDGTIFYSSVDDVISFWVDKNQTDEVPEITEFEDINLQDNTTVERHVYRNGTDGARVELYKVIGGGHTWPGGTISIGATNYDINGSLEIWKFFSNYDLEGSIVSQHEIPASALILYPNPTNNFITIETDQKSNYQLSNLQGKIINTGYLNVGENNISLSHLAPGTYFISIGNQTLKCVKF